MPQDRRFLLREREKLLGSLGAALWAACYSDPAFNSGTPIAIEKLKYIPGPRSGIVSVKPGTAGDRLYQALSAQKNAKARGLFPDTWIDDVSSIEPLVDWSGKRLHIEAQWPIELQTTHIGLEELSQRPGKGRSFTLGIDGRGGTVVVTLNQQIAHHILVGGRTGSGKTVATWTILRQLVLAEDAEFVLLNGKGNRGLGVINGLPRQVGPMATDGASVLNALGWCYRLMCERNHATDEDAEKFSPLYIIFDDFDMFTMADDTVSSLLFLLSKMGREVSIFLLCATQSPKQKMFGDSGQGTRAQFGVRLALNVSDRFESEAIVGDVRPRADFLSGSGDAYLCTDTLTTRMLIAYTSEAQAKALGGGEPRMKSWPAFNRADILDTKPGPAPLPFDNAESVVALYAVQDGWGRDKVNRALFDVTGRRMGSSRISGSFMPHGEEMLKVWEQCASYDKENGNELVE